MHVELLQELGLSLNEARIYETLISHGELSVSELAPRSKIHRRNVYDSINRLLEKGLVYEVVSDLRELRYEAVEPLKLRDLVQEKLARLEESMPDLERTFRKSPNRNRVLVYKGVEGWKNYMRDILRVGKTYYCIAGKGAWLEPRSRSFFEQFITQLKKKKIESFVIFDNEVKKSKHPVVGVVGKNVRYFPDGFSTRGAVEIFGDHVCLLSNIRLGGFDDDFEFTVVINAELAESFRTWFKYLWKTM